MFEKLNTPQELYNFKLGAALKMERNIVETLDGLIAEAGDEGLKRSLRAHQEQTRAHVGNVEGAFDILGWDVDDSPCPTIEAIEKEGRATIKKADRAEVDSVIVEAMMETEHHEVAVYEHLIVQARAFGRDDVAELLSRNLGEELDALQQARITCERLALAAAPA